MKKKLRTLSSIGLSLFALSCVVATGATAQNSVRLQKQEVVKIEPKVPVFSLYTWPATPCNDC